MTKTNKRSIEQILEDLSYAFASPESRAFTTYIGEKNYRKAKNMLLKKIDADEATIVMNHFKKEVKKKFILVEMTYEDFKIKYPYNPDMDFDEFIDEIVINYRGHITSSCLMNSLYHKDEWCVFIENRFIKVQDVDQIWFIEKK